MNIGRSAAAVAVIAAIVWSVARWPAVESVEPSPYGSHWGWNVRFTPGDAIVVPRERDTLTTEAVFKSRQVHTTLDRLRRRFLLGVITQAALVFVGLLAISWLPPVRRRILGERGQQ